MTRHVSQALLSLRDMLASVGPVLLFAIALSASAAPAAGEPHRVFVAGDSTASAYPPERAPRLLASSMISSAVSCPVGFCAVSEV